MDTDSFMYHIKTEDFYADIADDVEERFDMSGYDKEDARPLPIGKNKKVIGLMKDELGGKIMTEFVTLRPKLYSYRNINEEEVKKCKGIKKCVVKKTLAFDDYVNCLFSGTNAYRYGKIGKSGRIGVPHKTLVTERIAKSLSVFLMGSPGKHGTH